VLTIVRSYLFARCPDLLPPLASFQDWSRLIRSPLVWLGHADPVDTMEAARADDPTRSNLRAIVSAWLAVVGTSNPMTAGDLKDTACSASDKDMMLNKAINVIATAPGRSEIDPKRLGNWLSRNKGRIVDGIKIKGEKDEHSKQMVWWLENR
jgi:putative DNA primase/helicase